MLTAAALALSLTLTPAKAVVRAHASLWDTHNATRDRVWRTVAYRLPSGRWALPAWVEDHGHDVVWVREPGHRDVVLRDRPDSTLNGWAVYRVAWPTTERRQGERERAAEEALADTAGQEDRP